MATINDLFSSKYFQAMLEKQFTFHQMLLMGHLLIDWLIKWCFMPLSTVFQSYHCDSSHYSSLSWVSPVLGWGSEESCTRTLPLKTQDPCFTSQTPYHWATQDPLITCTLTTKSGVISFSQTSLCFLCVCSTSLLKALWEKEKLLLIGNLSFFSQPYLSWKSSNSTRAVNECDFISPSALWQKQAFYKNNKFKGR